MGLNIVIQDKNRKEHPSWDWIRQGDDRANAGIISREWPAENFGTHPDDEHLHRPPPNAKLLGSRGAEMLRILADPKWRVYLSC